MTKSTNGKGKGKAKVTSKPKKIGHCDHGKSDNGKKCATCYINGTGGEGIRYPCEHGISDNGNRCVKCYNSGEGGAGICKHLKRMDRCKECGGTEICKHGKNKQFCKEDGCGTQICSHGNNKSKCKICNKPGEGHLCLHGKVRSSCKECDGSDYCEHGRQKTKCSEGCGGSQICEHGRHKYQCPDCDGSAICPHNKQRDSCAVCNENYCTCCGTEKTSRRDAMCQSCLSELTGTSVEEIHLTSIICCALYGDCERLGDVSVQKVSEYGTPFDMVFSDISDDRIVVIDHDSKYYHDQEDSKERDTRKTIHGLDNGCIVIRHRHANLTHLDIENDDFHVVEFNGYSSKEYSMGLAVTLIEHIINIGILNELCMENAFYFMENADEFSELAKEHANDLICKMVLDKK